MRPCLGLASAAAAIAIAVSIAMGGIAPARAAASAEATRTFVSGAGTDTGGCGRTAPCRSFAYAITQTASGGEIVVLDSAGYGAISIMQPLTITNPGGVEAGVTATSNQNAVTVAAPAGTVTLRGLTLEGSAVGANGIDVEPSLTGSAAINILDCVIKDFANDGILVAATVPTGGQTQSMTVFVSDTTAIDNTEAGLQIGSIGINVTASVYRSIFDDNKTGVFLDGTASGTIAGLFDDDHADYNKGEDGGFWLASTGPEVQAVVKHSTALGNGSSSGNPFDVTVSANTQLSLYDANTIGILLSDGTVFTDQTNNIASVSQQSSNGLTSQTRQ